jgi:hypothetical protein
MQALTVQSRFVQEEAMRKGLLRGRPLALGMAITIALGCAQRIPIAFGSPDEPQASWRIRAGKDGNEREICRSDVDQPCVIRVGSQNEPMSVVVSVYLHPVAEAKTTYQGTFSAEFLSSRASAGHESQVDVTIEPGRTATGFTVIGRLTSTPGRYFFRTALLAEVPMHSDPHQFEQTIPVDVIAS